MFAFYEILLNTPLIACKSFIQALSMDFGGLCVAWHFPSIDGLNGLRPTLRVGTLVPPFKSSTAFRALAPTASFRGSLTVILICQDFSNILSNPYILKVKKGRT